MAIKRNQWPVILAGPPRPDFIFEDKQGREYVLSLTKKLYEVNALRKAAPLFRNKPVYESHLPMHEMTNGRGEITLTSFDPREYRNERVGFIGRTGFSEKYRRIHGLLHVTDPVWKRAIWEAYMDDRLGEVGLSMTPRIFASPQTLRVAENTYFPVVDEIYEVFSVDITDMPFFGGGFLNGQPSERIAESILQWRLENIGVNYK